MLYSPRITEAFALMYELHNDQKRKGSDTPYIAHLMSAAAIVAEYGGDEDQFIAALLHDAVEDRGGRPTYERIKAAFGETVAEYVWQCSDSHRTPKPPWRERKVLHIEELAVADPKVKLIVSGDKLHNGRSIVMDLRQHGEEVWLRFQGRRDGTLWYFEEMTEALRRNWDHPVLVELDLVVRAMRESV
jgi:(p)ppGpp synthase/HD superfamily hydrolase